MKQRLLQIVIISTLALFFISCGSSSNRSVVDSNKDFRILKVVVVDANNTNRVTHYTYNEQNLLVTKTTLLQDGISQEIEEFTYNQERQLTSQIKYIPSNRYSSKITYNYSDAIYNRSDLPVILSSDTQATFMRTVINVHEAYSYLFDEQGKAIGLEYTSLYRTTEGSDLYDTLTIYYTYDAEGRLITKGDTTYSYNAYNKLASQSDANNKTLYSYDAQKHLSLVESYRKIVESGNWELVETKSYSYENKPYDNSHFTITSLDGGEYNSSGIY